jgi:hypothetical protein
MSTRQFEIELKTFVDHWDNGTFSVVWANLGQLSKLWSKILAELSVQKVLSHLLYLPNRIPNWHDARVLLSILEYVNGKEIALPLCDDVIETTATISSVSVEDDNEGPTYHFTYSFTAQNGQTYSYQGNPGYDATHAALAGISRADMDRVFQVGATIPVKYRASNPTEFCLGLP